MRKIVTWSLGAALCIGVTAPLPAFANSEVSCYVCWTSPKGIQTCRPVPCESSNFRITDARVGAACLIRRTGSRDLRGTITGQHSCDTNPVKRR